MARNGRPTKYRQEMCKRVIELMCDGASKIEVCADLDIDYTTFLAWQEKHEDFSKSIKKGELLSQSWWERGGRTNLLNREFNHALWYMNMKNRFGWSDKQEVKQETSNIHVVFTAPNEYESPESWEQSQKSE